MTPSTKTYRVAYLEDNPSEAKLLMHWFKNHPTYDVSHFESIASFSRNLKEGGQWDLVISDVMLPDGNALDDLAHWDRTCPVIFMTASAQLETAIRALRLGFEDFIPKPIKRDMLFERMAELIGSKPRVSKQTIMAIGAHPDDVEIGVGGTLARHAKRGDHVIIVTLSQGAKGGDSNARKQESLAAAALIDATLVLGDFEDTNIQEGYETIRFLEEAIQAHNPTTIYTHTLQDGHQDHRGVHRASLVAARAVPNLYCYQAPSTTLEFIPKRFVEIEEQMTLKLSMLAAYQTQIGIRPYLEESFIRATAQYWGRFAQYKMVEPLEVIRDRT